MAVLTAAERSRIYDLVGWPTGWRQIECRLEQALNRVDGQAEDLVIIRGWLTEATTLDAQMTTALGRLKALKVGSIELSGFGETEGLRRHGRQLSGKLAAKLGVEIRNDYWGEGGPCETSSSTGSFVTGGNYVRIG